MTSPPSFLSLEGGLWAGFVSFFFLFLFLKEGRWEQELLLVRKEGRKERRFPPPTCHTNFAGPAKGASPPASAGEAGTAHQSKRGSARPWCGTRVPHTSSLALPKCGPRSSGKHITREPARTSRAWAPPQTRHSRGRSQEMGLRASPPRDAIRLRGEPTTAGHSHFQQ